MKKFEYEWSSEGKVVKARLERLNLEQTIEILKIFSDFDVTSIEELLNCNIEILWKKLVDQGLIYRLLITILRPIKCEIKEEDVKRMPPEYVKEIWEAFFFLYPKAGKRLVNFFGGIGSYLRELERRAWEERAGRRSRRSGWSIGWLRGIFGGKRK